MYSDPKQRFPHKADRAPLEEGLTPTVSYIVSTYNRPWFLKCCLASLACQSDPNFEVIVTDNSTEPVIIEANKKTVYSFDSRFSYLLVQEKSCYHSGARGATDAKGEYVCFPSDDSYYTPMFQEYMVRMAKAQNLGFVYCGVLYNGFYPSEQYAVYPSRTELYHIDKTQYLIRRELFDGFAQKDIDPQHMAAADGYIITDLVAKGIKHAKHEGALVVHN